MVDTATRTALTRELRRRRTAVLLAVAETAAELAYLDEERPAEPLEEAQETTLAQVLARLDARERAELEAIDAALRRMLAGSYGRCVACGHAIPVARLRVLPATPFCRECAELREPFAA